VTLLVLGVVRLHGEAHGYAVRRELEGWHVETWTSVKPGSIYHALHQLAKEGKLQDLGAEASPAGPGRTRYALTPAGELEFLGLVEAALGSFDHQELGAGVAFMTALPSPRVIALLQDLRRRALANRDHLAALAPSQPPAEHPPHMRDLLALWSGNLDATARWAAQLLARLEAR
jgi:DNA-binding PadR family transcriptional regulator